MTCTTVCKVPDVCCRDLRTLPTIVGVGEDQLLDLLEDELIDSCTVGIFAVCTLTAYFTD
jgi:hypothetical protein